jgi:dTDP-4-amino-4,6-dideoxygalactose transaminase
MYASDALLPVTGSLARRGIVLPTHAELTPEDVLYVCETLKGLLSD